MSNSRKSHIRNLYDLRDGFKYTFAYQFLTYPYEFLEIYKKARLIDYLTYFWTEFVKSENYDPETYTTSFENINISFSDYFNFFQKTRRYLNEMMILVKMPDILDINEPDVNNTWHNSVGIGYILFYNYKENIARFFVCESSMNSSMLEARLSGQYIPAYFVVEIINGNRRNLGHFNSNSLDEVYTRFNSFVIYDLKNGGKQNGSCNENEEDDEETDWGNYNEKSKIDTNWEKVDLLEKIKVALNYDKEDKQYKNIKKIYKEFTVHLIQSLVRAMSLQDYSKWATNSEEKNIYDSYYFDKYKSQLISSLDFLKHQLEDKTFDKIVESIKEETSLNILIDNICAFLRYWGINIKSKDFTDREDYFNFNTRDRFIKSKLEGETQTLIRWLSEDNTYTDKNKFDSSYREMFGVLLEEYIIVCVNENEENNENKKNQIKKYIVSLSDKNKLTYDDQKRIIYEIRETFNLTNYDKIINDNINNVIDRVSFIITDRTFDKNNSSTFDSIRNKFVYIIENLDQRKNNTRSGIDTALYKCKTLSDIVETMKPVVPLIPNELQPRLSSVLDKLSALETY